MATSRTSHSHSRHSHGRTEHEVADPAKRAERVSDLLRVAWQGPLSDPEVKEIWVNIFSVHPNADEQEMLVKRLYEARYKSKKLPPRYLQKLMAKDLEEVKNVKNEAGVKEFLLLHGRTKFDRLAGHSDILLKILQLLLELYPYSKMTSSQRPIYSPYATLLTRLRGFSRAFNDPKDKWQHRSVIMQAAYLPYTERTAFWDPAHYRAKSLPKPSLGSGVPNYITGLAQLDQWESNWMRVEHEAKKVNALRWGCTSIPFMADMIEEESRCFDGQGELTMADGSTKQVCAVKAGDVIKTQYGTRAVQAVFKKHIGEVWYVANVRGVCLSKRHPVQVNGKWIPNPGAVIPRQHCFIDAWYNFELEGADTHTDHTCWINGVLVATLGFDCPGADLEADAKFGTGYWKARPLRITDVDEMCKEAEEGSEDTAVRTGA